MEFLIFHLTSIITILLLAIYVRSLLQYWKKRNIPFLEPSFPFGNLANPITNRKALVLHFQELYTKLKEKGAKCGGIHLFCSPILLVIEPEAIRDVLSKNFRNFQERGFYNTENHQPISANLFMLEGDRWKKMRAKFSPMFTSAKMKIMFNLMLDAGKTLQKHLGEHVADGKVLIAQDCAARVASDIIGSCAFGVECFADKTIQEVLKESVTGGTTFLKMSFVNAMPKLAEFLRIPLIPRQYAQFLDDYIKETVTYRKENNIVRNDFLQSVIEMREKGVISMNELKAQCVMFFLAGYESSSNATAFLLFELAYNQEIQQKLRREIKQALDDHNGEVTYEAVMNLKYLDTVVCETLRKYPTIGFLNRKCVETFQLPNSDITIEKGTKIIVPVYALHHDPEYFPDPQKFDPDRFSDENSNKIIPYTYLPFGHGPRYCIGDRFARQGIKTTVVSLIRRYKFKLNRMIKVPLLLQPSGFVTSAADEILLDIEGVQE